MADARFDSLQKAVELLKRELEGPTYRRMQPERAFIEWYTRARYGPHAKCQITDGSGDGGIDALVTEGRVTAVLQSKYEPSLKLRTLSGKQLAEFELLVDLFKEDSQEEEFETWLQSVRQTLRATYRRLRKVALDRPELVRFDFVTSKRVTVVPAVDLHLVDVERIAPLWYLYEEGFTPPVESIEIDFEDIWSTGSTKDNYRNYVGLADAKVFLKLMERDEHERLFAQNVRTDLGTRINKEIRDTYERSPGIFWLGNNGIYIVCSRVSLRGKTLSLVYPSIINGSQTLHSLYASRRRHSCSILVRVLEMDIIGQRDLLNAIVKRTNTQNPMKAMNLAAHDREQLNVARYLDSLQLFYERREREWLNEKQGLLFGYKPLGIKTLAQWHASTAGKTGLGTPRNKVASLFRKGPYEELFARFGDDLSVPAYQELAATLFAGLTTGAFLRRWPKESRRRAKITQLLLIKAIYSAVRESKDLSSMAAEYVRDRSYQDALDGPVATILRQVVRQVFKLQKGLQRRDESLDLSNVFKRDDLTSKVYKKVVGAAVLKRLRLGLERQLSH